MKFATALLPTGALHAMRRMPAAARRLARWAGTSSAGPERSPNRGRWRAFLYSNDAGGMAIALAIVVSFLAATGAAMTNYAWREAQWEELESAQRAAIAALGPLLGEDATDPLVAGRLQEYVEAMQPGFEATTPTITRDANDVISVTFAGKFTVDDIWGGTVGGGEVDISPTTVRVKFEHERYEVAMALDVTNSMAVPIVSGGTRIPRIDALKQAMAAATDAVATSTRNTPGSLMVSVVPFASMVNVADTATSGKTAAKQRYVRMLAGALDDDVALTEAQVLAGAREDAADGEGQWVDTYHGYGVGADMGPLRSRGLPADLLNDIDWNLRRTDVEVPVGAQFGRASPADRIWTVDDEDFWNGCLMARWGAYWNPAGRPQEFPTNPVDPAYWPAETDVPGWSPAAGVIDDVPLHISDEPPDRDNPHTLFTAYSWPDASIAVPDDDTGPDAAAGSADHWLQVAMARLLDTGPSGTQVLRADLTQGKYAGHNHWNRRAGRGNAMCPGAPLVPLTDDLATVRSAVSGLTVVGEAFDLIYPKQGGQTFLVRGLVWALRTVSPLWEPVWQVRDATGQSRPGTPCGSGEATGCDPLLKKSILLVSDGENAPGTLERTRLPLVTVQPNPGWRYDHPVCIETAAPLLPQYHAAWGLTTANDFNERFANNGAKGLGNDHRFNVADSAARGRLDTAFRWGSGFPGDPLADFTPWELFRGPEPPSGSSLPKTGPYQVATDMLMATTGLRGRPTNLSGYCGLQIPFGPYGRADDHVLIGELGSRILPPVRGVAPFSYPQTQRSPYLPPSLSLQVSVWNDQKGLLDTWFLDACRLAGQRRVRVHAVFIGARNRRSDIRLLERCVDAAGGDPNANEVFVTPRADDLRSAFEKIFAVRRNLRFLS